MQCRLCLSEKPLLKESHIIPDFQYKELYDDKHRIVRISHRDQRSSSIPNGEYEANILCADCDNRVLGSVEGYASSVFNGGAKPQIFAENHRKPDGLEYLLVSGIDYAKFKLFLLSLLWKASISSRPFFANVALGPHEEKIRKMIMDGDPGIPGRYPCVVSTYRKRDLPKEVIGEPRKIRVGGTAGYAFLINGYLFMYIISENEKDPAFLEASLRADGTMYVTHVVHDQAAKILNKFFNKPLFSTHTA